MSSTFEQLVPANPRDLGLFEVIPPEIRLMIYNLLFIDPATSRLPWVFDLPKTLKMDGPGQLLHVSRGFREEIMTYLNKKKIVFKRTIGFVKEWNSTDMNQLFLDAHAASMIPNFRFIFNMDPENVGDMFGPWDRRPEFDTALLLFHDLVTSTVLQASQPGVNRDTILFEFHNVHRGICEVMRSSHLLKYLARLVHFNEVRFRFTVRECRRFDCCRPLIEDRSVAQAAMKQLGSSLKPYLGTGYRRVTRYPATRNRGIVDRVVYIFWPKKFHRNEPNKLQLKRSRSRKSKPRGKAPQAKRRMLIKS